jgi:hypothetical protein
VTFLCPRPTFLQTQADRFYAGTGTPASLHIDREDPVLPCG